MNTKPFFSFRNTKLQALLLFLGSLLFLYLVFYSTLEQTARPEFCSLCHAMRPEYYSLQASSHEKVNCVACHKLATTAQKLSAIKRLFYTVTGTYQTPIKKLNPIPDANCEQCHNVIKRNVTASGDVIIPHDVHKEKKISCDKCHRGVAHGRIADRRVTYRSDYNKWDKVLAKSLMTDDQTRPDMDTCMRCHKVRKGPLECKACHRTTMLPENHKSSDFKYKNHGLVASQDLAYCNKCHEYMSKEKIEGFEAKSIFDQYVKSQVTPPTSPIPIKVDPKAAEYLKTQSYAKTNTFCQKCHGKRPPSHTEAFVSGHGEIAKANKDRCFTCHDNQLTNESVVKVACASCHPSSHYKSFQWKRYHPVDFGGKPKLVKSCYRCHSESICGSCHKYVKNDLEQKKQGGSLNVSS